MSSGSKTYYDDYVRKQTAMKPSNSASSMHSDRGAYVNFLEVQLERVSAACLGVQSYDQRFTDMQGSLAALEQKHVQSTRLLALSQQCIEVKTTRTLVRFRRVFNSYLKIYDHVFISI